MSAGSTPGRQPSFRKRIAYSSARWAPRCAGVKMTVSISPRHSDVPPSWKRSVCVSSPATVEANTMLVFARCDEPGVRHLSAAAPLRGTRSSTSITSTSSAWTGRT